MRSVSPFNLNKPEASWNTNLRDASCYMLIEFTLTLQRIEPGRQIFSMSSQIVVVTQAFFLQ